MHLVGAFLGFCFHHPVFGLICFFVVGLAFVVGVHTVPDKMQERVDSRSSEKFKARRPAYMKAEKLRQIKEAGRREDAVFRHHKPVLDKAQRLVNSRSSRRQKKGERLLRDHNWMVRKEMGIVHHAANSARVHPGTGKVQKGIRRD